MGYTVNQHHGSYNRTKRSVSVKYIVVHYTGSGTSASGSALANCKYFSGGNRSASAHYFIDDASIYEYADPSAYACWHVGDGKGKYGITNANSVGIEVCGTGQFTSAEIDRLTWLVQKLMKQFGVPASRVVRHYDASRKHCPAYYVDSSRWNTLHAQITGGSVSGGTSSTGTTSTGSSGLGDLRYTGPKMVKAWQTQLGTTVDGVMSGQCAYNRKHVLYNFEDSALGTSTSGGSQMVRKLQTKLGISSDGQFGPNTCKTLQTWLGKKGYYSGSIDGTYGPATSTAVGKALEAKAFA